VFTKQDQSEIFHIILCISADHKQRISTNQNFISFLFELLFLLSHPVQFSRVFVGALFMIPFLACIRYKSFLTFLYWTLLYVLNKHYLCFTSKYGIKCVFFSCYTLFKQVKPELKLVCSFTALHFLVHRKQTNFACFLFNSPSSHYYAINFYDLQLSSPKWRVPMLGTYCYITYLVRIESQSISGTVAN